MIRYMVRTWPLRVSIMRTKHTGFTISLVEWEPTITTLWATVKGITIYASSLQHSVTVHCTEFITLHPEYVQKENSMAYLSDNDGNSYNLCHCMYLCILSSAQLTLFKIGVISKSLTWISGVVKHIKNISNIWSRKAAFIMRLAHTQFTRISQLT